MNRRSLIILYPFILLAIVSWIMCIFIEPAALKWAIGGAGLALIAAGLSLNSLIIASNTNRKIEEINTTLKLLQDSQREIREELDEQKEQSGSRSNIVPTLQAFTQLYMDHLSKQQNDEEQSNEQDDT